MCVFVRACLSARMREPTLHFLVSIQVYCPVFFRPTEDVYHTLFAIKISPSVRPRLDGSALLLLGHKRLVIYYRENQSEIGRRTSALFDGKQNILPYLLSSHHCCCTVLITILMLDGIDCVTCLSF